MDIELFLEGQTKWEEDSPHQLVMLYEMFRHAANKGQKEAEQMVCWGCQEGLPKLDPETDLSAIQLVGLKTTKEEILSLYLKVYKQQRLPGFPPGDPKLMEEVVSSFKGCQGWKEGRTSGATSRPWSNDAWPSKTRVPGKRETLIEQSLATVREAYQKALAMAPALEREIERLNHPLSWRQPEVRARLKSKDCWMHGSTECKRRWCQVRFSNIHTTNQLAWESPESGKGELTPENSELGKLLELEPGVTSFLTGSVGELRGRGTPSRTTSWGVMEMGNMEGWDNQDPWLVERVIRVAGSGPTCKKLAQQVWASFSHPRRARETKEMKYHCHAPPAPPCLLRNSFQPPPNTIFACWDIREIQREKIIAYAHSLQYWAEKSDPPAGGQPHQLAESVKKLREEMRCYLSFTDKEVFEGVTPLEGMPTSLVEESQPPSETATPVITPKESTARKTPQELAKERKCPKFPRWEKVLHPFQPVSVAGQPPHPSRSLEQTYLPVADSNQPMKVVPTKTPSPMQGLEVAHRWMPTPSFLDVTTCLRNHMPEEVPKAPPVPVAIMAAPGMVTMSTRHVVWDEATGAIYLDMVTTSKGRVALSVPEGRLTMPGPEIEDVTDLI